VPAVVSNIPVLLETTGSVALYADPLDPRSWIKSISALEKQEVHKSQVEKGLKWWKPLKGQRAAGAHIDIQKLLEEGAKVKKALIRESLGKMEAIVRVFA